MCTACQGNPTLCESTVPSAPSSSFIIHNSSFSFKIPADEDAAYRSQVPSQSIEDARRLLAMLEQIDASRKVQPACKRLADAMHRSPCIVPDGDRLTRLKTWSAETLRAKYYAYTRGTRDYKAGDWRICLDKSKNPIDRRAPAGHGVPATRRPAFVEFWRKLCEDNAQDCSAAYSELIQIWKTGHGFAHSSRSTLHARRYTSIPGYAEWPKEDPARGHPDGWSYPNLMRHVSDRYDLVAARVGYSKATEHRLPVLTTRTKIQPFQFVEFDDHWFNQKTMFQRKPMRPIGFGAVELFSAAIVHIGCKPILWNYEDGAKLVLTKGEFLWFVVAYLTTIGYRADIGTEFIAERGTSVIPGDKLGRPITDPARTDFEKRLWDVTGGKVTVYVGGRHGRPAHAGQWNGRSKGNYKTKALLEGTWGILDDAMGSLPAQVGLNRDRSPEQLHGAEKYTAGIFRQLDALQKEGTPLTDEQLQMLQFPFPNYWQWREWMLDAVHRVNTSRRHDLEGWEKLGFVQPIWRLPTLDALDAPRSTNWLPWTSFLALPPQQQQVVKAMLDADPSLLSTVRLSRQEVFHASRKLLTTVPMELIPGLVGIENAHGGGRPVEVKKGLFTLDNDDIDSDTLAFYARGADGQFLPNASKYVVFVNPYAPSHLIACSPTINSHDNRLSTLKVAAVCARYDLGSRADAHSIEKLQGDQNAFEAQARARLNLRHSEQAAAKQSMIENNQRLLGDPRGTLSQPSTLNPQPVDDCTNDLLAREHAAPPAGESETWE
jgi:hypothetical protein